MSVATYLLRGIEGAGIIGAGLATILGVVWLGTLLWRQDWFQTLTAWAVLIGMGSLCLAGVFLACVFVGTLVLG